MSPRRTDSRRRMVAGAADLLAEHGAAAVSIDRVLAHSGAPRGSVYHHFPGGRVQLIDEAVVFAGDFIAGLIETAVDDPDPLRAVDAFFTLWRERLVRSDFRVGCPVVAVAVENDDTAPEPARSAAAAFARWQQALTALLLRHGLPEERGRRLAAFLVAAVEGAVVLCRAERGTGPLDAVAVEVRDLLDHALRTARPPS
ncbi:TetR/AcrR family transcriptional regulator [Streptomyces sp. DSM 15324]|uniref:TetR/AcrR family transcriptional regulator n=1 Tax=Streptomyces sp. DSM 15324 TaxID=1739111 RepID=UPI000ADCFB5E|nr:TetR/AcrR family transcriptional regulator [Streptomyces sp. DSM 15324]